MAMAFRLGALALTSGVALGEKYALVGTQWADNDRAGMPSEVEESQRISAEQCDGLTASLSENGLESAAAIMEFVCQDEKRAHVESFGRGCLYVPTSQHVRQGLNKLEGRKNNWHFIYMLQDSFFPLEDASQSCPTAVAGQQLVTHEGHTVTTCASGFLASDQSTCLSASPIGSVGDVQVYALDGLMGLDQVWYNNLLNGQKHHHASQASQDADKLAERGARTSQAMKVDIELDFVICSGGTSNTNLDSVTDDMIQAQVDVLNMAYGGKDTCRPVYTYEVQHDDSHVSFHLGEIKRITNSMCKKEMWDQDSTIVNPQTKGKISVLLAKTENLGYADLCRWKGEMVLNPCTVPGGTCRGYNEGDTLTHELGHFLNLEHTFQGGCKDKDKVDDTNAEKREYYGCPKRASQKKTSCGSVDPIHNFMDYADDKCMCSFTAGQSARVWACLETGFPDIFATATPLGDADPVPAPSPTPSTCDGKKNKWDNYCGKKCDKAAKCHKKCNKKCSDCACNARLV